MAVKKGTLSIDSENIFPIIKKWVYSDHDIFVRELVSNGCDAITKLKKLDMMGEYELPEGYKPKIEVIVNPEEKTMKFIDNGLGMTAEEVEEYITQIAFSGATQFLEKYKDKTTEDDMIGHFGLGFYSAFMVADEVQIDTLSYKEGAKPVHWASEGGTEYEMQEGSRTTVGSEITLYLNEDSLEFANEYRAREVLERYCSFMPVEIFLSRANAEPEYDTIDEADVLDTDTVVEHITEEPKEGEEGEPKQKAKIVRRPVSISDIHPLWTKNPSECTKEEYIEFYRKVFMDYKEPLFWIHLNMDYPFNLKGILYFPKINTEYESIEGKIKLYNNQVFIADNIKEVIPEFLMVLKGVIDCPDLPLNVSRSALQNDGFVNKVADYISKKVADKLNGMFKTDRENYEKYWDDISPFIKFGCLKDEKFGEKMKDSMLYKNLEHKYLTLEDIIKEAKDLADETIRNFNKYGTAHAPVSEMEKERTKLRDKMNNAQKKMSDQKKNAAPNHKIPKKLRIGDRVKVISMNLNGTVHSLPNAKGDLYVQMGILRSLVNINDLILLEEETSPTSKKYGRTGAGKIKMSKSASVSTEINLIGKTTDEAIALLDKYLDDAYLAHIPSVRIVHGKGTGALRNAVQAHLKRLKYVKSFHLGEYGEGDAGVTIAEFKD